MSTNNNFQSFAFVDSPPPRIQRTADKKAKLVFLSSDDEGDKVVAKATTSTDSSPWIEAIDHNNPAIKRAMEKPIVFQAARTQLMRNTMVMQNPITKRDIGYVHRPLDPLPESSTVDMRAILSAPKKDSILDKLSDDYDPLFEARERANQQKALIREQRVQKREESLSNANANTDATNANNKKRRIFLDSDDEEGAAGVVQVSSSSSAAPRRNKVISLDSDEESPVKRKEHIVPVIKSKPEEKVQKKKDRRIVDSDDEYEDGWNDELTKAQLKSKADDVIKQCERVSKNLRASLKEWEGNKENTTNDCINLTSIQATTSQGVLNDADIDAICPGLVLNNYQLVGVNWLRLLYINNVNGVLADDMGLGKTVQTIAFLAWLTLKEKKTSKSRKPHLVVVPASTLSNWENELDKFCPTLNVVKYHGSQNERVELRNILREQIADGDVDIILSTYTIFEREASKVDRSFIYNQKFDFLVLDEAHCIKNADSSRYTNMNAIRSEHRLLLSGTPVQNDLSELLALLSFLMPSVFGKEDCTLMMEAYGWDKHSKATNKDLNQLKVMLSPFVLRRLKRDVLDQLSDKTTMLKLLDMSKMQKSVYEGIIHQYASKKEQLKLKYQADSDLQKILDGKILKKRTRNEDEENKGKSNQVTVDLCSPPSSSSITRDSLKTEEEEVTEVDLTILEHEKVSEDVVEEIQSLSATDAKHLFTALRKAANHPLLLRVHYTEDKIINKIATMAYHGGYFGDQCTFQRVKAEIEGFSDYDIHNLCLQFAESLGDLQLDATTLYNSPKMEYLRQLLPQLQREGHRMLLFSQWTKLLDLLEILLQDMNMQFLRLDGSTPIAVRQELIDTYNTNTSIPVFLLSTKAGGLGINLTAADTVILHDLDFNPENDKQAEDRCHRIGQTRPVTIYKLVAKGTVDEDIYEMGERKRELSQAVLSDHRSPDNKDSKLKKKEPDDDMNMISRILSKALNRTLTSKN